MDKQPYYTANNFISFQNRVPRTYTFDVIAIDSTGNASPKTTQTFELKERSLTELIEDASLIEKAFLDGKLTIYFTAPSGTPEDYDLLVANLNEMTLEDFSYASKQLEGFTFDDFASGLTYKYWYGGKWWICTKQQLLVIQRILAYVVTLDASTVGGDGNIRVFNKQPFVPYSVGDLWLDGDTIKVCQTEKLS